MELSDQSEEWGSIKKSIDAALANVQDVQHEKDTVVTTEYLDALTALSHGLHANAFGPYADAVLKVYLDSMKLIAENECLRHRLKEAFQEIVKMTLKSGAVSLAGRVR